MTLNLKTSIALDVDNIMMPEDLKQKFGPMAPGFSEWFNDKGYSLARRSMDMQKKIYEEMGLKKKTVSVDLETVIAVSFLMYRHFLKNSPLNESMVNSAYAEGFMKGHVSQIDELGKCWDESKVKKQMAG